MMDPAPLLVAAVEADPGGVSTSVDWVPIAALVISVATGSVQIAQYWAGRERLGLSVSPAVFYESFDDAGHRQSSEGTLVAVTLANLGHKVLAVADVDFEPVGRGDHYPMHGTTITREWAGVLVPQLDTRGPHATPDEPLVLEPQQSVTRRCWLERRVGDVPKPIRVRVTLLSGRKIYSRGIFIKRPVRKSGWDKRGRFARWSENRWSKPDEELEANPNQTFHNEH